MLQFLYGVFLGCCQLYKASLVAQLVKNPPAMPGDLGSIPALGKPPGEGKGYPLQYSGLENSMDFIVHGVTKCQIRLSDFHFTSQLYGFNLKSLKYGYARVYTLSNAEYPSRNSVKLSFHMRLYRFKQCFKS